MDMRELRNRRADILSVAARHGAANLRVFGSTVTGEGRPGSDVDFLVDLEPDRSLLDLSALLLDLEDLLGHSVDIVEPEALHECIRDHILREAVPL